MVANLALPAYVIRLRANLVCNLALSIQFCIFKAKLQEMSRVIGREKELKILEQAMKSETSQFIAVYGRRRVGKTSEKLFNRIFHFTLLA